MACNHIFEGRAGGVKCRLCGAEYSTEEYLAMSAPKAAEKPKTAATEPEKKPAAKKPAKKTTTK